MGNAISSYTNIFQSYQRTNWWWGLDFWFFNRLISNEKMTAYQNSKNGFPKTFLRIGSYYKTTIDNLKIMNHLKLLTKYN